jgi:hypothetical protein
MPNTPANDHWEVKLASTLSSALGANATYITFLPDGSIDRTRTLQTDIDNANSLLAPAISSLQAQTIHMFEFWELINWLFVSFYWTALFDLGQIAPTIPDAQMTFLPTNNLFINQTLFTIYSSYLRNTIFPLLGPAYSQIAQFSNLTAENSLQAEDKTFVRSYSCVERVLKQPVSFIISVIVADYALIMGAYAFAIFVAGAVQKRRRQDGEFLIWRTELIPGNRCEGCIEVAKDGIDDPSDTITLRTYQSPTVE